MGRIGLSGPRGLGWSYPAGCSGPPTDEDRDPSELEEAILGLLEDAGVPTEVNDKIMSLLDEWQRKHDAQIDEEFMAAAVPDEREGDASTSAAVPHAMRPPRRRRSMTIKLMFCWFDLWVGLYWSQKSRTLYVCPLPMVVIALIFGRNAATAPDAAEENP